VRYNSKLRSRVQLPDPLLTRLPGPCLTALSPARRESEKAASDLLRQANQARSIIEQAVSAATSALQQLEELKQAEKEAAAEAGEARAVIKQLQGAAAKRRR
jgi:hypothetical protein